MRDRIADPNQTSLRSDAVNSPGTLRTRNQRLPAYLDGRSFGACTAYVDGPFRPVVA